MNDIGSAEISAGVLSSFMKLLDLTMDTIFSPPTEAENLPTIFAGRPIALVRAELELEVDGSTGQLEMMHEVSLGSIDRSLDGLLDSFSMMIILHSIPFLIRWMICHIHTLYIRVK